MLAPPGPPLAPNNSGQHLHAWPVAAVLCTLALLPCLASLRFASPLVLLLLIPFHLAASESPHPTIDTQKAAPRPARVPATKTTLRDTSGQHKRARAIDPAAAVQPRRLNSLLLHLLTSSSHSTHNTMPLCGGSKTVQRKLVLLYVDNSTPGHSSRLRDAMPC